MGNVLREVLSILENGKKWGKGDYEIVEYDDVADEVVDTRYCILGAIHLADPVCSGYEMAEDTRAARFVAKVVEDQYPDRLNLPSFSDRGVSDIIAYFNDNSETTFDDVERVIEKASILMDEGDSW